MWYKIGVEKIKDASRIPTGRGLATKFITEATPADWVARGIYILAIGLLAYRIWEALR